MIEEELFHRALQKPTLGEQLALLDQVCADQPDVRRRVERLLRSHRHDDSFLHAPVTTDESRADQTGTVIGPYKLIEPIGEGGMGTVWMAQQTEPVKRVVALKVIKAGMDSKQVIARFEAERQALALMDHANIARVLDGGTTRSERPYFVMDLVKGVPITKYCDEHHLTPRQRLELFIPVCQAVQHAHQKGIIHRDLKPSNVLVALYDGKPVPKVIDFGVAKAAGQSLTDKTLVTGFGNIVGTLEYMSPEQAEVNQLDIDTRSDIYSLGVLLYELLTGTTPLERKRVKESGMLEALRIIREEDVPTLSNRLATTEELPAIAANRGTEASRLTALVRGELDWIVMKALEKDRSRRYETANAFAADVQRYLNDDPVLACPPSVSYRLRKFARRNKWPVTAAACIVLALVVGIMGTTWGMLRATDAEAHAVAEAEQTDAALADAEANLLLARQAVDEIYTPVAQQLAILPHMQPYQRDVMQKALEFYREFAKRKSSDPAIRLDVARASLTVTQIQYALGLRGRHEQAYREAIATLEQLVGELPSEPMGRLTLGSAHNNLGGLLAGAGRVREAEQHHRRALALYAELVAKHPEMPIYRRLLAAGNNSVGALMLDRPQEAEKHHREAIRLCQQLVAEYPAEPGNRGQLVNGHCLLGYVLAGTRRLPQAEGAYREAVATYEEAHEQLDRSGYRSVLSTVYHLLGKVLAAEDKAVEAESAHRQAIGLGESLAAQFPDIPTYRLQLLAYRWDMFNFLWQTGRRDEAAPFGKSAAELYEKLLAELADDTQPKEQVIEQLRNMSSMYRDAGELQSAEKACRKALELAQQLAADSPTEPSCQFRLAEIHWGLGIVQQRARRIQEAADSFREQLAIYDKLAAAFPKDPDYRYHQARAANFLGIALRHVPKKVDAAIQHHRKAIELCDPLVAQFQDIPRYRVQQVRSHYALGLALMTKGRWAEAKAALGQAQALWSPEVDQTATAYNKSPLAPSIQNDLAWLLATCPEEKIRDPKQALELARKTVEADPKASYWNTLGVVQYRVGDWKAAVTALEKSTELGKRGDSFDWFFLAMAHWELGEKDTARQWYDKAVSWMEKNRPRDDELRRFHAEAAKLLGVNEKKE